MAARDFAQPIRLAAPERGLDGRGVLSKARPPQMSDGRIGDFWIDSVSKKLYGPKNAGEWPDNGLIKGDRGWTPVFAIVVDGTRRVQQIADWTGGEGAKPNVGQYVGADGLVDAVADAIDFRGPEGPQALINALEPKAAVTYGTQVALGEPNQDNQKAAVADVFAPGGILNFKTEADAVTQIVPKTINRIYIGEIGRYRVRVASEPTIGGKMRTADRFLPNGNVGSANGGWWADDVAQDEAAYNFEGVLPGTPARRSIASRFQDQINLKDFGAKFDGQTNISAQIAAANELMQMRGGGTVRFPEGSFVSTYSAPPAGIVWDIDGEVDREQIGGASGVKAQRATFGILAGPHTDHQKHLYFIRASAKGSGAIGAQYGDYALGIEVHKEFWSETQGTPAAGEIDGLTINYRNGGPKVGEPLGGISSGAAILANVGATDKSGASQVLEAVNSVFNPDGLEVTRQIGVQVNMLNTRDDDYYGLVLLNNVGSQDAAITARARAGQRWNRLLESAIGGLNPYYMTDTGGQRWQSMATPALGIRQDFIDATAEIAFRDQTGTKEIAVVTQNGFRHREVISTQNGAAYTLTEGDCGKTVMMTAANAVVTLPKSIMLGFRCRVLSRDGQVSFVVESGGVALRNVDGHSKTKGAYAVVDLTVPAVGASAIWYLSGATGA